MEVITVSADLPLGWCSFALVISCVWLNLAETDYGCSEFSYQDVAGCLSLNLKHHCLIIHACSLIATKYHRSVIPHSVLWLVWEGSRGLGYPPSAVSNSNKRYAPDGKSEGPRRWRSWNVVIFSWSTSRLKTYFIYVYFCVHLCVHTRGGVWCMSYVCWCSGGQMEILDPPELALQTTVDPLTWVLGTISFFSKSSKLLIKEPFLNPH